MVVVKEQPPASDESAPRRGRPGVNRAKLLAAADACLRERGYANTTARDLVAASGTNLASIGYHFGSKEALLNEAIARGMTAWTAAVEQEFRADASASVQERMHRGLAAMLDHFDDLEPYLISFVEGFPPALRSTELRETMATAYEHARESARRVFAEALAGAGTPVGDREAEVLAALLIAILDGLILQWLLRPGTTPRGDEVMAALRAAAPAMLEA